MIAVVRLPIQAKLGHVEEGSLSYTPEAYHSQLERLDSLIDHGYRVHAVFPVEDRLFRGVMLILHKTNPDENLT